MSKLGVNELRRMYLEFFESKEHLAMKSFSLVPQNDNSLLLINAGMAPLKPYFTGQEIPPRKRVTTCQKCIRTGDIDNVGKTARHLTFFEMLGNFSFGDYFKEEAIAWSWEFLTKVLGLEEDRLYPSIYGEDEEAFEIWTKQIGVAPEKVTRFYRDPETGECDNFWEHGAGPCGPCSEIYYDRGIKYGCGSPDCKVGCDCDRFMEVWNNVFTQFNGDGQGGYEELENKNIDTGMGLERLAVVMQEVDSVFDIDTMKAIRDKICELSNKTYQQDAIDDISIRLITDHIRSATFLVSDGVRPTNEGRGYVLRRLIRRAARHGRMLGIQGCFLAKLSQTVIEESKDGYPELGDKQEYIFKVLTAEEEQFNKTIDQGLVILAKMEEEMEQNNSKELSGENAFKLYDTYGFPVDLTEEILAEKGYTYDEEGFARCMEEQRTKARDARQETNYMGTDASIYQEIDPSISSSFVGYETLQGEGQILVMTSNHTEEEKKSGKVDEIVTILSEGMTGTIIVDKTPFYATMGGQIADTGMITWSNGAFQVIDTVKLLGNKVGHIGTVVSGTMETGATVTLAVDQERRGEIAKNHSATHLLQKALREVLGSHVEQQGSDVNPNRLRFDFSHPVAMTGEELAKVEQIVNEKIRQGLLVETKEMTLDEARATGAMALFNEKYGETVRVVSMGDFSVELCGGTHVGNTEQISSFKIVSETGVAAGVRRIEALSGAGVFAYYQELEDKLATLSNVLKTTPAGLVGKVEHLLEEVKQLRSENEALKSKAAKDSLGDVMDQVATINEIAVLVTSVEDVDMNGLRELGDDLKGKLSESVILLASAKDGKVSLMAMATEGAIKQGAHAGNLIKTVAQKVGGGGGGRPNMAQAGGKNPEGMTDALETAKQVIAEQLNS